MRKLSNFQKIPQSVAANFALCFLITFPALAQLPSLPETQTLPSTEAETSPSTEAEIFPSREGKILPTTAPEFRNYYLGPGDEIEIDVAGFEELTDLTQVIPPDGRITLPLIGRIKAAGNTPEQLQQGITRLLSDYLVEPAVNLTLARLRPVVVNVAGEVHRPGPIQLNSLRINFLGTQNDPAPSSPEVSGALAAAGGVTRRADLRQIVLRRSLSENNSIVTTINLWDTLFSGTPPQDIILQDGDSIFVPRLTADATIDPKLVARSSLAPATIRVRVVGEVTRPGEVTVPPDSTLSSAVAIAGGPTVDAKLEESIFIRINEEGVIESKQLDLSTLTDNNQVQEGDVIIVPRTATASDLDIASRSANPVIAVTSFLRLILSLFGI